MEYVKSPMNYIGNKYRIIDQITKFFPKDINVMADLFCGGCDVTINTSAKALATQMPLGRPMNMPQG